MADTTKTSSKTTDQTDAQTKPVSAQGRQAGDYDAPVLNEPQGGPIPDAQPFPGGNAARDTTAK